MCKTKIYIYLCSPKKAGKSLPSVHENEHLTLK